MAFPYKTIFHSDILALISISKALTTNSYARLCFCSEQHTATNSEQRTATDGRIPSSNTAKPIPTIWRNASVSSAPSAVRATLNVSSSLGVDIPPK